jgi:hypothetical protein
MRPADLIVANKISLADTCCFGGTSYTHLEGRKFFYNVGTYLSKLHRAC